MAAAGHRPFREQALLANLLGLLAPGGMLVLTGMEPFEPCRTPEEEVVRTVLRWWDALTYLSGEEIYREAPAGWVVERLREAAGGRAGQAAPAGPAAAEPRFEVAEPVWTDPLDWSLAKLGRAVEEAVGRAEASARPGSRGLCPAAPGGTPPGGRMPPRFPHGREPGGLEPGLDRPGR